MPGIGEWLFLGSVAGMLAYACAFSRKHMTESKEQKLVGGVVIDLRGLGLRSKWISKNREALINKYSLLIGAQDLYSTSSISKIVFDDVGICLYFEYDDGRYNAWSFPYCQIPSFKNLFVSRGIKRGSKVVRTDQLDAYFWSYNQNMPQPILKLIAAYAGRHGPVVIKQSTPLSRWIAPKELLRYTK